MKIFRSSSGEGGSIPELPQREIPAVPPAELQPSFPRHFSPIPCQWLSEDHASFAAAPQNLHPDVRTKTRGRNQRGQVHISVDASPGAAERVG